MPHASERLPGDLGEVAVLCVDDEPGFADLTAAFLERNDDDISATAVTSARDALDLLATTAVDCVVSDYDMPGTDGLGFLEAVRSDRPDLPFIMFTGRGSEEIASDAISAGVTDYMRKEGGSDQYAVLARRVRMTVERAHAQAYAEEERQRSQTILNASPDVILVGDADGLQYANPAAVDFFAADDQAALLDRSMSDLVHPDDHGALEANFEPVLRDEAELTQVRRTFRTLDGTPLQVEMTARGITWDGRPSVVAILRDVTARDERERKLADTKRQLEGVLDSIEAAVWMKDTEGRFLLVNQQWRDLFDCETTDVVGMRSADLFPEAVAAQFEASTRQAVERGETVEAEEDVPTVAGDRTFLTRISPLFDDGEVFATCGVATDITSHERRQAQLAANAERMEAFASVVSHDLRNPLNTALGYLELTHEDDEVYLDRVEDSLHRAVRIVEDVLWLARENREIGATEPVDLREQVEAAWETVPGDRRDATLRLDDDLGRVDADESRLRQLLENLLRNAVEHGGASVAVRVERTADGFAIEDDGPGIPPSEREQVFERGHSTTPSGNGIGLAIVDQVAAAHGWDVTVTEGEWGGARFEFATGERGGA